MTQIYDLVHFGKFQEAFSLIESNPKLATNTLLESVIMSPSSPKDVEFYTKRLVKEANIVPDEKKLYLAALYKHTGLVKFFISTGASLQKALKLAFLFRSEDAFETLLTYVKENSN